MTNKITSKNRQVAVCEQKEQVNVKFSIELFAGAGGLALGLEQAGFCHKALVEYDENAVETLKTNRPEWNVICEDVKKLSEKNLCDYFQLNQGELDLLSGGVPCQSFSYAGKKLGLSDARGSMFHYFVIFLKQLQPKLFLFENVGGLLTHDKGKTYEIISEAMRESGYFIHNKILNANDYEVPQKRERLIIVGIRNDLRNFETESIFPEPVDYKPVLADVLLDVPESDGIAYSEMKQKLFTLVPEGGCWKNIPENAAKEYMKQCWYSEGGKNGILRRLSMDKPSLTLLTTPSQKLTERCHPVFNRPLTIREYARIQTFPDDWIFTGNIMNQYKQIGNAVPVKMAYHIGIKIIEILNSF